MMRKLRQEDFQRMPWKDGGGETLQIAIGPADATLDDFDWRVSSARVASSGPFSAFPGVDRSLAVIDGGPLRLLVAGGGDPGHTSQITLTPDSAPFSFAGEWPVHAELPGDGCVVDLNIMTRRDRFTHRLQRLSMQGSVELSGTVLVLYCVEGAVECHEAANAAAPPVALTAYQALVARAADAASARRDVQLRLDVRGAQSAWLWVVHLYPVDVSDD